MPNPLGSQQKRRGKKRTMEMKRRGRRRRERKRRKETKGSRRERRERRRGRRTVKLFVHLCTYLQPIT